MTGAGIEMVDRNKTPCIDRALAVIEETRSELGVGEPVTGRRFELEQFEFEKMERTSLCPYYALSRLAHGDEAWWIVFHSRLNVLICCVNRTYLLRFDIIKCINDHVESISYCRNGMAHNIRLLTDERNWILALPISNLAEAWAFDTQYAKDAMDRHGELVSTLKSSTTPLVVGSGGRWAVGSRGINGVCVELEKLLAGVQSSGDALAAFSPTTGSVSMPTEQLLSTSKALSDYAVELEAIKCGPEFLTEVEKTHGLLAAEDFIPALSRFVELHNLLLATVSAKVLFLAESMGDVARSYIATDAMAAGIITRLAANS